MKIIHSIFSVKTVGNHYVLTILGVKLKFKIKNTERLMLQVNQVLQQNLELKAEISELKICVSKLYSSTSSLAVRIKAARVHPATFGSYKNRHVGEVVTIIASGPSVNDFVPIEDSFYCGINNSCLCNKVKFDYIFLQELHKDSSKNKVVNEYNANNCKKFYGIIPDNRLSELYPGIKNIPESDICSSNISRYYLDDIYSKSFTYDLANEPVGDFGGTVFSAMQFVLYTHPKKIYLVGCDCSCGYFFSNAESDSRGQVAHWLLLKQFIKDYYPDVQIISVNPVGLKGIFEDIYTTKEVK